MLNLAICLVVNQKAVAGTVKLDGSDRVCISFDDVQKLCTSCFAGGLPGVQNACQSCLSISAHAKKLL